MASKPFWAQMMRFCNSESALGIFCFNFSQWEGAKMMHMKIILTVFSKKTLFAVALAFYSLYIYWFFILISKILLSFFFF